MKKFTMLLLLIVSVASSGYVEESIQKFVYTITHDGHKFVVYSSKGGIVHHPECYCEKEKKSILKRIVEAIGG